MDRIKILDHNDLIGCPFNRNIGDCGGEWRLWLGNNGIWRQLRNLGSHLNDDEVINQNLVFPSVIVSDRQGPMSLQTTGFEVDPIDDYMGCRLVRSCTIGLTIADNNEWLGRLLYSYNIFNNFGVGSRTVNANSPPSYDGLGEPERDPDFQLSFHITELKRWPVECC